MPNAHVKSSPFYLQIQDRVQSLREQDANAAILLVDIHGMKNSHDDVKCDVVIGKCLFQATP